MSLNLYGLFGAMNHYLSPAEVTSGVNSAKNAVDAFNRGAGEEGVLESAGAAVNMSKLGLAFVEFAAKEIPGLGTGLNLTSLAINLQKANGDIGKDGTLSTTTRVGIAADITGLLAGGAIAVAGAAALAGGAAAATPVALLAVGLTLLGTGLTYAAVVTDGHGQVDLGNWNWVQNSAQNMHDGLGAALGAIFDTLDPLNFDPHQFPPLHLDRLLELDPNQSAGKRLIDNRTATTFSLATQAAPARRDPLILDLDGNGLDTTGINTANPILFDHDADGIKTATGWIKPTDAFLVLDRNGNGTIDNGAELFGDATPLYAGGYAADGFAALAQEDSNADGMVDALDTRFTNLRLWTDLNQDGVSQSNELFTLEQKGIAALIVAKTENAVVLANGNQIADLGGYIRTDGSGGTLAAAEQLADIDLASNPFFSEFADHVPLTVEAESLPDMNGAGQVRDLREAASLDTAAGRALAAQLAAYAADPTRGGQLARLDGLVKTWADTSTMATTATGAFAGVNLSLGFEGVGAGTPAYQAWLDKLTLLERFNGQTFLPVPAAGTTLAINFYGTREALLDHSYQSLKDSVYAALVIQTRLKPYLDSIELNITDTGIVLDYTPMMARLDTLKSADAQTAVMDLLELQRFAGTQLPGWNGMAALEVWLDDPAGGAEVMQVLVAAGLAHSGSWSGGSGNEYAIGSTGVDRFNGNGGDDVLIGRLGDDILSGGAGNDMLDGGTSNDLLEGGNGSDTYVFRRGDGNDTISNLDASIGHFDTLLLDGLNVANIRVEKSGTGDLAFVIPDSGESITVQNFFISDSYRIDAVRFADGTTWDRAALLANFGVYGTAGDDTLTAVNGVGSRLYGYDGNDALAGGSANDTLDGGTGTDVLSGGLGNDVLDGGMGDDLLDGGAGSDIYVFLRGGGNDSISNLDASTGRFDTLLLEGLNVADIRAEKSGTGDLAFVIRDSGESIKVQNFFISDGYRIDAVRFADGTTWDRAAMLDNFGVYGTVGNDTVTAVNGLGSHLYGYDGNDTLNGGSANDALDGGAGTDILSGGLGNDMLDGGAGTDTLDGGAGSDTYVFRRGDGNDTISNLDASTGRFDTLMLEGLNVADIRAEKSGTGDLAFVIRDSGESIKVLNFFISDGYRIDAVRFADGTTWDRAAMLDNFGVYGTAGNDTLAAVNGIGSRVYGYDGNDTLTGGNANDTLDGGTGADYLYGGAGNDTLDGGTGNDWVEGGFGSDTYIFRRGSGYEAINAYDPGVGRIDTLVMEGLNPSDIILERRTNTLVLIDKVSGDGAFIQNYYLGDNYKINVVRFADGSSWSGSVLNSLATGNHFPTLANAIADQQASEDSVFSFTLPADTFADAEPGSLTLTAQLADGGALPTWLSFDPLTRRFAGTPDNDQIGTLSIKVTASDAGGLSAFDTFDLTVANTNDAPTGTVGAGGTAVEGDTLTASNSLADEDGLGVIGYQWQSSPDGTAWSDIADATMDSFLLTADQVGQQLRVVASYLDGEGTHERVVSQPTSPVVGLNLTVTGTDGNDSLIGAAGDDTLFGGLGTDWLSGGAGNDRFQLSADGAWVSGFVCRNDGSPGHAGSGKTVSITGLVRSFDAMDGGAGSDLLLGTAGNDVIVLDDAYSPSPNGLAPRFSAIERIDAGDGNDVVDLTSSRWGYGDVAVDGGTGDDVLWTSGGNDSLNGGAGNDTLDGGWGGDIMVGGLGNDTYVVDSLGDVVVEATGEGTDTVQSTITYTLGANLENLTLLGGAAISGTGNEFNNALTGNALANVLAGGAGNDRLNGAAGADTLIGGLGDDIYTVDNLADAVIELSGEGTDLVNASLSYALAANVERLTLTGTLVIDGTGNELDNLLTGNAAANVLAGGAGNDALNGGAGADTLIGGLGNDIYTVDTAADVVVELAGEGVDLVNASASYALSDNVENLTLTGGTAIDASGNALDNLLTGNSAINTLSGGLGNDWLDGKAGADTLIGGAGDDVYVVDNAGDVVVEVAGEGVDRVQASLSHTLAAEVENLTLTGTASISGTGNALDNVITGTSGNNTLTGDAGNDTLDGKAGTDVLVGGSGNDTYVFGAGYGRDTIRENDSTAGNSDAARFLAGIAADQIWLRHVGNHLEAGIIGTTDKLTLENWYLGSGYHVEQFQTADGKLLLDSRVENLVQAMAAFAPPAAGQTVLSPTYQDTLAPVIAANWQ